MLKIYGLLSLLSIATCYQLFDLQDEHDLYARDDSLEAREDYLDGVLAGYQDGIHARHDHESLLSRSDDDLEDLVLQYYRRGNSHSKQNGKKKCKDCKGKGGYFERKKGKKRSKATKCKNCDGTGEDDGKKGDTPPPSPSSEGVDMPGAWPGK